MKDVKHSRTRLRDLFHAAQHSLHQLVGQVTSGEASSEVFDELRAIFEGLPLNTAEFALASCRLDSAARYFAEGQHHVAAYELKLLRGLLVEA